MIKRAIRIKKKKVCEKSLKSVQDARNGLPDGCKPSLLLKLAPDLSYEELQRRSGPRRLWIAW
jgi:dihydroorotate dehydrogenase